MGRGICGMFYDNSTMQVSNMEQSNKCANKQFCNFRIVLKVIWL